MNKQILVMITALSSLAGSALAQSAPAPADPAKPAEPALKLENAGGEVSFWKQWTGGVEAGLNGSTGNTETFNLRAGAKAERKGEHWENKFDILYNRATDDGTTTKNRVEANLRNDYKFGGESRWRLFTTVKYEYDDFQDWNHRLSFGAGVGYALIQSERTLLVGRAGIGVRKEFGGSRNEWIPEGILGLDFEHKLTERQKLTATVDYLPSLDPWGPYRLNAKAAWEVLVDPESKLSLKIGAEDRYDSDPGADRKKNDLDYFAMLVWAF